MPLLFKTTYGFQPFCQGTLRIYLIIYQVLGNSLHCQETDDLHNFQFHRLEFLHIHCHYHNRLDLFHIYALLCSNSKNSDILKLIIATCNSGNTILCTQRTPANERKLGQLIVTYFINFKKVQQILSSQKFYSSTASCNVTKVISL